MKIFFQSISQLNQAISLIRKDLPNVYYNYNYDELCIISQQYEIINNFLNQNRFWQLTSLQPSDTLIHNT